MLIAAGLMAVMIAVSSVTYLAVERPAQGLGRRVGRRLDTRFGLDRIPPEFAPGRFHGWLAGRLAVGADPAARRASAILCWSAALGGSEQELYGCAARDSNPEPAD